MAENSTIMAEDTDMPECEGEKVVTMMDVLQQQQDFEDDANAVLGASDDKECTYPKGYIKRQAVYACLTCCPEAVNDPNQRAGVCLACSLNCHENHELIELYTKRNFRCDCGNPKFNSNSCQFTKNKTELNNENTYNQNFNGLYCTCHRPYPDPEANVEEEMIQCIICEDWLHASHLDAIVPNPDQYAEMICKSCMDKNEFLHDYSEFAVNTNENGDVDILNESNVSIVTENGLGDKTEQSLNQTETEVETSTTEISTPAKEAEVSAVSSENIVDNSSIVSTENDNKTVQNGDVDLKETTEETASETNTEADKNNSISENNEKVTPAQENLEKTVEPSEISEPVESNENGTEEPATKLDETKVNENGSSENNEETPKEEVKPSTDINNEDKTTTEEQMDTNTEESKTEETKPEDCKSVETVTNSVTEPANGDDETKVTNGDHKRKLDDEKTEQDPKKAKYDKCVRPKNIKRVFKGATFWQSNFRQTLCTCTECLAMYKDLAVLYLIDPEDTVTAYEALGQEKTNGVATTQYEKGLEALSSLDRIQQINALTEYNKMKEKLVDFLKSFKDRKEVVKEEDIKAFFAGMKPKRESDGVYFCR